MECEILLWYINFSVYKDCPDTAAVCTLHLVIVQDENEIQIHPDLSVGFNGYKYNIQQVRVSLLEKCVLICECEIVTGFWCCQNNHQRTLP